MFCLLVVLVKLSLLAKWLARKTPPVCFGWVCVCLCVGESVTMIARNCVHQSLQNWVYRICRLGYTISSWLNFGRPVPPGRGFAAGWNFFGYALLQAARSVCVSPGSFSLLLLLLFSLPRSEGWPLYEQSFAIVFCLWRISTDCLLTAQTHL